ncbi:MAG: pyridoxamine 5'-phosphate oxidase family protein [Rhodospirillaceae bacterium]|nr:pyridoxamine 5'-phosphate oxidase family protein [Rhodospirillaceae bacterium]
MAELLDLKDEIRRLMNLPKAYFGTMADRDGNKYPFVSLVVPALDGGGCPLLLLSDLSDHVKNLQGESKASLLFDGTAGRDEPLTGPRVTLLGEVSVTEAAADREAYLARHPSADLYAGFKDFRFYRFTLREALLVAGFGRIHRLGAEDLAAR